MMGSRSHRRRVAAVAAGAIFISLIGLLVWIGAASRRPTVVLPPELTAADTAVTVHTAKPAAQTKKNKTKKSAKQSRRTRPRSRDFLNEPVQSISSDSAADIHGK